MSFRIIYLLVFLRTEAFWIKFDVNSKIGLFAHSYLRTDSVNEEGVRRFWSLWSMLGLCREWGVYFYYLLIIQVFRMHSTYGQLCHHIDSQLLSVKTNFPNTFLRFETLGLHSFLLYSFLYPVVGRLCLERRLRSNLTGVYSFLRRGSEVGCAYPFSLIPGARALGNSLKLCLLGSVWAWHEETLLCVEGDQTLEQASWSYGRFPQACQCWRGILNMLLISCLNFGQPWSHQAVGLDDCSRPFLAEVI